MWLALAKHVCSVSFLETGFQFLVRGHRFDYSSRRRNRHLWSDHTVSFASGVSSSANKKRKGKCLSSAAPGCDPFPHPIPALRRYAQKPAERRRRQVGQARTPRKRSPSASILSPFPRAKLREGVYRLNPEMARMVAAKGSA